MLQSNYLKVEDENTVLSFIVHYSRLNSAEIDKAVQGVNQLAKSLRYNFLSFYNVMSALRKCEPIQLSEVFVDSLKLEYKQRLKMGKVDIISQQLNQNDDRNHYSGAARKYFNHARLQQQGRLALINNELGVHTAMFEEVMEWAMKSKCESAAKLNELNPRGNDH